MGEDRVHTELKRGNPNAKPTSLIAGVIKALRELGAKVGRRRDALSRRDQPARSALPEEAGFNVVNIEGLNVERDSDMVRITPEYLPSLRNPSTARRRTASSSAAARCVRSASSRSSRKSSAKPVVVSNQAMIWDTWRMAGIRDRIGRLRHAPERALKRWRRGALDFAESAAAQPRISPEEIHATIRDRICLLEYAPGSLLREAALAVEFGVVERPSARSCRD